MLSFIPTIDISDGKAVLVQKGKVYRILGDAMEMAKYLSIHKVFQLIDIDAAIGSKSNRNLIKKICEKYQCYVGGGIRTYDDALELLNSSARRVIISTNSDILEKIPKNRSILAIDIDESYNILTHGRTKKSDKNFFEFLNEKIQNIEMITITFHHKEGTNLGIPLNQVIKIKEFISNFKNESIYLVCAGGISSIDQIKELFQLGVTPQFGSGFWCGKFTLGEVYAELLNYDKQLKWIKNDKGEALFPCVIQSDDGVILGSVYCNNEAIKESVDKRKATFFSRDSNKLWMKGETSGYEHTVLAVHFNCDYTSLRFIVEGEKFCHLGSQNSCFGETNPNRGGLKTFQKLIKLKKKQDMEFSNKILIDSNQVDSKIIEESERLVYAREKEEIISSTSDLLYYSILFLDKKNLNIDDVEKELIKRRYCLAKNDLKCIIGDENVFTIGIVGSHCDQGKCIEFLSKEFKTKIVKASESSRSYLYNCENKRLKVIIVKPKDISTLLNNGFIDAILSYEDVILNSSLLVEKISLNKVEQNSTKIVVACKYNMTFDDFVEINKSRKIIIMAEYMQLISNWLRDNKLNAKLINVHGSSESYLVNDLCDLIVVVSDTGTTLKENNLKILDVLRETAMYLFVNPEKKYKLTKL